MSSETQNISTSQKSEPEANTQPGIQGQTITRENALMLLGILQKLMSIVDDECKLAADSVQLAAEVTIMNVKLQERVDWLEEHI